MYKFGKKISVLLIAMMLMAVVTGCGGDDAADTNKDAPAENNEQVEESAESNATTESGDLVGELTAVKPANGSAELTFDQDGEDITLLLEDSSQLFKFTISNDYEVKYEDGKITEFKLVQEEEEE